MSKTLVVGVLALQGAFREHLKLLKQAASEVKLDAGDWTFREVRTPNDLENCSALIIPGGESTTISLVAERSGLLEPLREFVKYDTLSTFLTSSLSFDRVRRRPVWGTCAGLILLAESANRTKKGGQDLIGGLDVRVNRNHFGRQMESFQALTELPFLGENADAVTSNEITGGTSFNGVFIRAPIVEKLLPAVEGVQEEEGSVEATVIAPSKKPTEPGYHVAPVEVLATLQNRSTPGQMARDCGDIIAVRQGNVFGTSFHPELTDDPRIHVWWLRQLKTSFEQ